MADRPKFDRSVPEYLTKMLDGYEAVFRGFFGLDLEFPPDPELKDPNVNRFEASLEVTVLQSAESLAAPPQLIEWRDGLGSFPAGDLNRLFGGLDLVVQQLDINLARADLTTLQRRRVRVVELASLVIEQRPTLRTAAYLARCAKCYVLDLLPECVVMCRSAL